MKILVDTNVLVRSIERRHPLLRIARDALRSLYEQNHELFVTPQNISEFWNVCTRPVQVNGLGNNLDATARLMSRMLTFFTVLPESMEAFHEWKRLVIAHAIRGAKVHDARLVAVIKAYGLDGIVTFNTDDFARYRDIQCLDPRTLK